MRQLCAAVGHPDMVAQYRDSRDCDLVQLRVERRDEAGEITSTWIKLIDEAPLVKGFVHP